MINITEEQLKEIVTQAHMAGQHNQAHCDPSYFEAETHWQKQVKNLGIFSVSSRYEILDKNGDKMPDHHSGRKRTYEESRRMLEKLNYDGEYKPYKMVAI